VNVEWNLLDHDNAVANIRGFRQLPNIEPKSSAIATAEQLSDNPTVDEDHDAGLKQCGRDDIAWLDPQTVIRRSDDLSHERRARRAGQQLYFDVRSVAGRFDLGVSLRMERAGSRSGTFKKVLQSAQNERLRYIRFLCCDLQKLRGLIGLGIHVRNS
jgi:hypothetical protein